jgi:hypothetical protein
MVIDFQETLSNDFIGGEPASPEANAALERSLGKSLPQAFRDFLGYADGGEGFIGDNYLVLWSVSEIGDYNRAYQVEEYAPGLLQFGSNGGGGAYAFDTRKTGFPVVMVPFVGMELKYARTIAPTFDAFLEWLRTDNGGDSRRRNRQNLAGKEIFEVQPVVLGGSPTDPGNKVLLTRRQHIEAVRYWNRIIRELRLREAEH